jgi:hypothetical protein
MSLVLSIMFSALLTVSSVLDDPFDCDEDDIDLDTFSGWISRALEASVAEGSLTDDCEVPTKFECRCSFFLFCFVFWIAGEGILFSLYAVWGQIERNED